MYEIDEPCNANERFLYGINMRLNILIEQMSGLLKLLAEQDGIATTTNTVVEEVPVKKSRKKKEPV